MVPWLSVSQLMQSSLQEGQTYAVQSPPVARETTSSPEWLEAETGAGGKSAAPSAASGRGYAMLGLGTAAAAIGTFFEVRAQQSALKSKALSMDYEQALANTNARSAEREAQTILESGQKNFGALSLRAGQEKGARRALMAARGVQLGQGSAAEVQASGDIIKGMDRLTIGLNAARGAAGARRQAVNFRNQGLMAGVSAQNLRGSAGNKYTPYLAAAASLAQSGAGFYPALTY